MTAEIYLVGLGGAGTTIVKSIFEDNDGKIPLRGLVVDIDHTQLDSLDIEGLTTLPLAYEKGFNAQMGELYNSELHLDNPRIIPLSEQYSDSKSRRYSRAIFKYNIYKKQLLAQGILDRFGQDFATDSSAKCMLIISALGGGTGSAILLDIANHIRGNLIDLDSKTPVFGIGIMGAHQDVSTHCKAATYATLLELKKSMQECSLYERAFDGFMLLDLDEVINKLSDQKSHPIEQAQEELTTAIRCFVNDFLANKNNLFNNHILCSNHSDKNFTFCTMNVDYTVFPIKDIKAYLDTISAVTQYKSDVDALKDKISELHLQISSLKSVKNKAIARQSFAIEQQNNRIEECENTIKGLNKQIDDLNIQKDTNQNTSALEEIKLLNFQKELSSTTILDRFLLRSTMVHELKSNIRDTKNKINSYDQFIKEAGFKIDVLSADVRSKLKTLKSEKSKLQIQINAKRDEIDDLNNEVYAHERQIKIFENEIDGLNLTINNRQKTMNNIKNKIEFPFYRFVRSYPASLNSELYNKIKDNIEDINVDNLFGLMGDCFLDEMIYTTVRPAKYLHLIYGHLVIRQALVAFGMKDNPNLNNFRRKISNKVLKILAPYVVHNAKIQTYSYNINDDFSIYGYAFFNNISLENIHRFNKYYEDYVYYFLDNPDIHAYDVEYWENKIEANEFNSA